MKGFLITLILIFIFSCSEPYIKEYYTDGALRSKYQLDEKGDFHGVFKAYYESGTLGIKKNYVDGKEEGEIKVFWENGNLKWKGNYENGKLNGQLKFFHENGELSAIEHYKNGEEHGWFESYSDKGIPEVKVEYDDGNIHGEFWYFDEDGNIDKVKLFRDGELVSIFRNYKPVEEIETLFWLEIVPMVDTLVTDADLRIEFTMTDIPDVEIRMGIMVFCDSVNPDRSDYIRLESYNKGEATYQFKPANFGVESNDRCEMIGFVNEEGGKDWQVTSKAVFYVLDNDAIKIP